MGNQKPIKELSKLEMAKDPENALAMGVALSSIIATANACS